MDVVEGIPDRGGKSARRVLAVLALVFVGWIALLVLLGVLCER